MTIKADIQRAKALFDDHSATHGCRPAAALAAEGKPPCLDRIGLWLEYQHIAGRWGLDADDAARARDWYRRNVEKVAA